MAIDNEMTTAEVLEYLGTSRTSMRRYQKEGLIEPSRMHGQTKMYLRADVETLREKMRDLGGKGAARFGRKGKKAEKEFQNVLADVAQKLADDSTHLSAKEAKDMRTHVQESLRAAIAHALLSLDAVKLIAADLYDEKPQIRHSAFEKLMRYVMPTMQSVSVEKVGGRRDDRAERLAQLAMQKVRQVEEEQNRLKLLTGPVRVLEAEVVE